MGITKPISVGLSLLLPAAILAPVPSSATVMLTSNMVSSEAFDGSGATDTNVFVGTTIPTSQPLVSMQGAASNTTQIEYSASGSWTTLSYGLTHARPGALNAFAQSSNGTLIFTVDADSSYDLSGAYAATDINGPGRVLFESNLFDLTDVISLQSHTTISDNTANENFTLGVAGGDDFNLVTGSLTGSLIAGHSYQWSWLAFIVAFPEADGGSSATGQLTLTIHEDIPEPATLAIFGLGLAGLGFARRRQSKSIEEGV